MLRKGPRYLQSSDTVLGSYDECRTAVALAYRQRAADLSDGDPRSQRSRGAIASSTAALHKMASSRLSKLGVGDCIDQLTIRGFVLRPRPEHRWVVDVLCDCSCGAHGVVMRQTVLFNGRGGTRGCFYCAHKRTARAREKLTGYVETGQQAGVSRETTNRLLRVIGGANRRCHDPKDANYKNYGARGIQVFEDWRFSIKRKPDKSGAGRSSWTPFELFIASVAKRKFLAYVLTLSGCEDPTLELDRIDNDKGYEPGNLRFSTLTDNLLNRRTFEQLESYRARLRYLGLWPTQSFHDCYADGLLSLGA